MLGGIGSPCAGFEVESVSESLVFVMQGNGCFHVPQVKLGGVRNLTAVVRCEQERRNAQTAGAERF